MGATTSPRAVRTSEKALQAALTRCRNADGRRQWGTGVFPCPIELFEIIAEGTILCKAQALLLCPDDGITDEAVRLLTRALAWSHEVAGSPRWHLEEAYRQSIVLYIIGLCQLDRHFPNCVCLARGIIQNAQSVPEATAWSYSMSWPLFQAGLHLSAQCISERAWLVSHFKATLHISILVVELLKTLEAKVDSYREKIFADKRQWFIDMVRVRDFET